MDSLNSLDPVPGNLAVVMKDFLLSYKEDSKRQEMILESTRDSLHKFQIDFTEVKTSLKALLTTCESRRGECSVIHHDFESRLRNVPPSEVLLSLKQMVDKVERKLDVVPSSDSIANIKKEIVDLNINFEKSNTNVIKLRLWVSTVVGGGIVLIFVLNLLWPLLVKYVSKL